MTESMISLVLPIFFALAIGVFCSRRRILSAAAVTELKNLVTTFFLPLLTFQMFSTAELGETTIFLVAVTFLLLCAALFLGFAASGFLGEYGKYGRFLTTSAEGGMIGVGLFQMIYGTVSLSYLAPIELAQGLFYFTVYLTVLTGREPSGQNPGGAEKKIGAMAAAAVRRILTTPVLDGCLLGILYQLCGLADLAERAGIAAQLYACIDVFTALIMPLILVAIGFELSFSREIWLPIIKTVILRCCILGACVLAGIGILRLGNVVDPAYYIALAFEFSLPPAFLIVVYVKERAYQKYLNAFLSVYVLLTLVFAVAFKLFFQIE